MDDDAVMRGLAANPALPGELLEQLIERARDDDLAEILAERDDLSQAQADTLAGRDSARWARKFADEPFWRHRKRMSRASELPEEEAARLAGDADVCVVAELAWEVSAEVAAGLARHPHADVRIAVAQNPRTPAEELTMLVTGVGLPALRWCELCEREGTPYVHPADCPRLDWEPPPETPCDGSHQPSLQQLLVSVVGNPSTPADAVVEFVGHPDMSVRWRMAERGDMPQEVYTRLAGDVHAGVRGTVARNPAIGEAVARMLAGDADVWVRRELAHNPAVPLDVLIPLAGIAKVGKELLPRVAAASPAEVAELAASADASVRTLVAHRTDLPALVRDALAVDPDAKVVKIVASHPGLSEGQLRGMVERHGVRVAARVAVNPDVPWGLLEELALQATPVAKVLRVVAARGDATPAALMVCLGEVRARRIAAAHPALPVDVVVGLLGHEDPDVVEAAAANPSLPVDVMLGRF